MRPLCSLLFKTTSDYQKNLNVLLDLIKDTPRDALIVAPEVCLTGFFKEGDDVEKIVEFAAYATGEIKKVSQGRIIILTMIERRETNIYNMAKIFHNGEVIHERGKVRLFNLGSEERYFTAFTDDTVMVVEVDGVKLGILICFELRFKELWQRVGGADIIAVPSWWGALRSEHFKILTQSLAVMNQCYVVASDSENEECTKQSGIINPFGEVKRNGQLSCLRVDYDEKTVQKMRRYLDVGIG